MEDVGCARLFIADNRGIFILQEGIGEENMPNVNAMAGDIAWGWESNDKEEIR